MNIYVVSCLNATFGEWMKNHVKYVGMNNWQKPQWMAQLAENVYIWTSIYSLNGWKVPTEAWVKKKCGITNSVKQQGKNSEPTLTEAITLIMFLQQFLRHINSRCVHKFLFIISMFAPNTQWGLFTSSSLFSLSSSLPVLRFSGNSSRMQ